MYPYYYNLSSVKELSSNHDGDDFVKTKTYDYNGESYKIISYTKHLLNDDTIQSHGLFRSVILNSDNQVVSFSPPKSIGFTNFFNKYGDNLFEPFSVENAQSDPLFSAQGVSVLNNTSRKEPSIAVEEFVEGTMVNLFWDSRVSNFVISTKNTVGGEVTFFKKSPSKTFYTMFCESVKEANLEINNLDKDYCYSFVIQHPDNRIVTPFRMPYLYLIAVYKIDQAQSMVSEVDRNVFQRWACLKDTSVKYALKYDYVTSYQEAINLYASAITPYYIQGVVFKNTLTGERSKVRNVNYETVRKLRGNQTKTQYQYLLLRGQREVREFLNFYPEFKDEFAAYRDKLHQFTNELHSNYADCYIKKQKPLTEYPKQFRSHMFNLSKIYKETLKPIGGYVNKEEVIRYVNGLPTDHLMYSLNYEERIKRGEDNAELVQSEYVMV